MGTPLVMGCDSADVDASTQTCAHPYWVAQQGLFPSLDAASGITIGVAILVCWATAYGFRKLRRTGE